MYTLTTTINVAISVAAVVLLAACPPAAPPPVPPGIDQPGAGPDEAPAEPTNTAAPAVVIDAAAPALAADGKACSLGGECASGICEGLGCGEAEGLCAPADRGCTRDMATFCGCSGSTFRGSGSCPGQRFAYRGPCVAPVADGQPCESGDQCVSGVCEGQGCDRGSPGICVPAGRMCTADVAEFCDCRGTTFTGSSSCPGRRYRSKGNCSP